MANREAFRPDWTSAPSDTISDLLAERGIGVAELAAGLGETTDTTQRLLDGRSTITLRTARALSSFLGASVQFWMMRDLQYRDDVATLTNASKAWLAQLPVGDMIRYGWLKPAPRPAEELDACLRFFAVSSVSEWHTVYDELQRAIAFRTSPSFDSRPGAVAAWLRQGERQDLLNECSSWDRTGFQSRLGEIRTLTRIKDPRVFLPKLQGLCAKNGVVVSIVKAPTGCRASGATRLLPSGRALVILSFRYLTDDQFWFTFFHEAGHLVLHHDEPLFLEDPECQSTAREKEANEFAARLLVPNEGELLDLRPTARSVIRLSVRLGIAPGIVVGQMQHCGKLRKNQLNQLKRRYRWSG